MICIIDTCVILDLLLDRKEFATYSEKILELSAQYHFEGAITAKCLADIHYFVRKHLHSEEKARKQIHNLIECLSIFDTTLKDIVRALSSNISDYEDAIIDETAFRVKADYIITRNIKDFAKSKVPAILPKDFLKLLPSYS